MEAVFEVKKMEGDVIFVEDDIILSPDHRDFSLFASAAKMSPEAFAFPVNEMLSRVHYVTYGPTNGAKDFQFDSPDLNVAIIRYTPYYFFLENCAYMINSTYYKMIQSHLDEIITTKYYYEDIVDVNTGLVVLAETGLYAPIQLSPSFARKWHIGTTSTVHEYDKLGNPKESDKKDNKTGYVLWTNILEKSPWRRDKGLPGAHCDSKQCEFSIRPYWTNPAGQPCAEWDSNISKSCKGLVYLSTLDDEPTCGEPCFAHNSKKISWPILTKTLATLAPI